MPVPLDARERCEALIATVRAEEPPGRRQARWVRTDGLHITLRFLGVTPAEVVAEVEAALHTVAVTADPFEVVLGSGGAFPTAERPRVLWLGILEGGDRLAALAAALSGPLAELGWPPDERPYRAHLTIARTDAVPRPVGGRLAATLTAIAAEERIGFAAREMVLFRSVTGGGAARYEPLASARLGGAGE